jgi:hypothetical protein
MRLGFVLIAVASANGDFWSKINDDSMSEVMEHSPGFKQMIMSACEMITLGRAGYPKNIPKETVEKLCTKMYPPFAHRGKPTAGAMSSAIDGDMYNLKAGLIFVVAVGMVWYVWSASAPDEVFQNHPPPTWEINRVAQSPQSSHSQSPQASQQKPAVSPVMLPSPASAASYSPAAASPAASTPAVDTSPPSAEQVAELRRARLSRFDSAEQS